MIEGDGEFEGVAVDAVFGGGAACVKAGDDGKGPSFLFEDRLSFEDGLCDVVSCKVVKQ